MFDAGWEPVTEAVTAPATVRVERYGPRPQGEALFAVYNPATTAVATTLRVDAAALKLAPKLVATELVTGQSLTPQVAGGQVTVSLTLPAGTCFVVRLGP